MLKEDKQFVISCHNLYYKKQYGKRMSGGMEEYNSKELRSP